MIPYCNYNGIGIIPWGPIAAGHLTRPIGASSTRIEAYKNTPWNPQFSEADKTIISRVEEIGKKHGRSMAQIALAWVQAKVASPIVGVNSIRRIEDNILGEWRLPEEDAKYLEEA
jgi:aryl-alcohol dehydrogenase-like predicted oxidoreductase